MSDAAFSIEDGLAVLGAEALRVLRCLDDNLVTWALDLGAHEVGYPPLQNARELQRIDYFENFPHLGFAVAPLAEAGLGNVVLSEHNGAVALDAQSLASARYLLPSAACYPVYWHLKDQTLAAARRVTTCQQCFRNESRYEGLARLRAFNMRELVIVGTRNEVQSFLYHAREWIALFAEGAGVPLSIEPATDPFYEPGGERAKMQELFPVKDEFVFESTVAVSSVNFHRNFFGERWGIRTPDNSYAFSGCVAFGLERWLHALWKSHQGCAETMLGAIVEGTGRAMRSLEAADGGVPGGASAIPSARRAGPS